jgi:hypothetical protein
MEKETKIKIIGTGIFAALALGIALLVYQSGKTTEPQLISSVVIKGNKLLNENKYLEFTRLSDISQSKLTLPVIKSRIEKHPYVLQSEIKYVKNGEAEIRITEKNIYGVIVSGSEMFFLSENFQVIPVFAETKISDMPMISNVADTDIKVLQKVTDENIFHAARIIDAAKLINPAVFKNLAEINLRNVGDIILNFSGLSMPVIFGRNYEVEKLISLEELLKNNFAEGSFINESNYIDLRFYNDIFIGNTQRVEL